MISKFFTGRAQKIRLIVPQTELITSPTKGLRLLIFCGGSYISGMEINALNLMKGLLEHNHSIQCIVSGWNDGDFISRLETNGIPFDTIFLGKLTKSFQLEHLRWMWNTVERWPGALWKLHQILQSFQPDVVLLFNRDTALLAAPVLYRWPCVFHVAELDDQSRWNILLYKSLDSWIKAWIGVSHFIGAKLETVGISKEKIRVVHNGIPPSIVFNVMEKHSHHPPTIGICGQIGPWKGHDDLIDALAQLFATHHDFQCSIFGRGNNTYIEILKQKIITIGFGDRIKWRGFFENVDEMYREIDILAVPSRFEEPFGLVAAEAGLNRIPAVVTRRGGLPEIILDGETGFIVEAQAPTELAARLAQLLDNSELRKQMGAAARQRVKSHFTVEQMVKGHEQVLFQIAAEGQ